MFTALGALMIGLSLDLLGSGGSILTVPTLVFLVGEPAKLAITESLGIVGIIAGVGAINHARLRHIDWHSVLLVGPPSMFGSFIGAWMSQWINGHLQLLLFSVAYSAISGGNICLNDSQNACTAPSSCLWLVSLRGARWPYDAMY